MLNEIFKGMDNAAEQINENFLNGSIVESGSNDNGRWVKLPDGTQISTGVVNIEKGAVVNDSYAYALPFASSNVTVSLSTSLNNFQNMDNLYKIRIGTGSLEFRIDSATQILDGSGQMPVRYSAIGRWKVEEN